MGLLRRRVVVSHLAEDWWLELELGLLPVRIELAVSFIALCIIVSSQDVSA